MAIPKIMHFIWIGTASIPPDRLNVITEWQARYPEFEIYFWIDKLGTERDAPGVLEQETNILIASGIKGKNIKDVYEIKDKKSISIIRYEIDRLRPNYGAASDLIRYEVLHKYGGYI